MYVEVLEVHYKVCGPVHSERKGNFSFMNLLRTHKETTSLWLSIKVPELIAFNFHFFTDITI